MHNLALSCSKRRKGTHIANTIHVNHTLQTYVASSSKTRTEPVFPGEKKKHCDHLHQSPQGTRITDFHIAQSCTHLLQKPQREHASQIPYIIKLCGQLPNDIHALVLSKSTNEYCTQPLSRRITYRTILHPAAAQTSEICMHRTLGMLAEFRCGPGRLPCILFPSRPPAAGWGDWLGGRLGQAPHDRPRVFPL